MRPRLGGARGHVHELPMWGDFVHSVGDQDAYESIGSTDIARFE